MLEFWSWVPEFLFWTSCCKGAWGGFDFTEHEPQDSDLSAEGSTFLEGTPVFSGRELEIQDGAVCKRGPVIFHDRGFFDSNSMMTNSSCVCPWMLSHFSRVWLFLIPWTVVCRLLCPWDSPGNNYWSGLLCPPPGDLPDPGIKPMSISLLHWQVGSLPLVPPGKTSNSSYSMLNKKIITVRQVLWELKVLDEHIQYLGSLTSHGGEQDLVNLFCKRLDNKYFRLYVETTQTCCCSKNSQRLYVKEMMSTTVFQ